MNRRERIISALNHRQPDMIPVDFGATDSSGITWIAYSKFKKELGLQGSIKIFDLPQMIVKVEQEVLDFTGSDAAALIFEPKEWKIFKLLNGYKVEIPKKVIINEKEEGDMFIYSDKGLPTHRFPKNGFYFDAIYHPLKDIKIPEDINKAFSFLHSYDCPEYMDESPEELKQRAILLHEKNDYAIVGNLLVHLFAAGLELRGFENFMTDLVLDKKMVHIFFEKLIETYIPRIDKYLETIGDYIDVIQVNDDLGTQNGLLVSKDIYREMIKPYHKKLWQYIRQKSGKYILLHSCGSIYELIPDLIEMGVDAVNPVQISAKNMDSKKLKSEFGKDITFWGGGCDTQEILPYGSPLDVKKEVKKRVSDFAKDGGFVFSQVHNIQADVPVENIFAMYEALKEI